MTALLDTALDFTRHGFSVVPIRTDGTKSPAVAWKQYTQVAAGEDQVATWFANGTYDGMGVVTGTVSGNLELLEVEGRAVGLVEQLAKILTDRGYGELWSRLCNGYLEQSPSGGLHWLYRVDGAPLPNTKLARRPTPDGTVDVLIETRGQGGQVVTAPSAGRSHPTGRPWTLLAGKPSTIPILSVEERDALYVACTGFDTMPALDAPTTTRGPLASVPAGQAAGERPGDDYNARTSWDDILVPHGWTKAKSFGPDRQGWTRPGKHPRDGISATTGDNLYVFSSSTEFDTETPYSRFAAYTVLEHGGDYTAAAKELRARGYGREESRPVLTIDGNAPAPQAVVQGATVTPLPPPQLVVVEERTLVHTDDANGLALVDRYGDVLRHCADRGRWYAWDGHVWAPCPRTAGPAREYAKRIARSLPERNDKDVAHKKKALSAIGITSMLTQAASDDRVAVDYAELDAHPWELNTPGGIVNLQTGQLTSSNPDKLHTRLTSCTPDADADRTAWLRFLDVTFGSDPELIAYMQRLVGYSAVGLVGAHVLPYCIGSGGNGKGVFLETCVRVLRDYATTAPSGFLMAKTYQGHETELARLAGARMVVCSEVNDDDRFDEARVKQLTGGDSITARFIAQDHFTFAPSHQLWAMGNHRPHVRAGGPSFWRRLRLIPFLHEVPDHEIIEDLQDILASQHGPAVLAWIVEGAVAYHQGGLRTPVSVLDATGDYARDQDTVTRFLNDMCHVGGGEQVCTKVATLRSAYESWCREAGDQPISAKAFGLTLQRHGFDSKRTNTARMYVGVGLVSDAFGDSGDQTHHPEPALWVSDPENASHASPGAWVTNPENASHASPLPGLGEGQ